MRYPTNRAAARIAGALAFWGILVSSGTDVLAQLPRTRLTSVAPAGGRAGSRVTVTIGGDLTQAATQLVFSHPGIEATQQLEAPTEYRTARRKQRVFDVHIGDDVPNGNYEVRALGPGGLSNPRLFSVSRLAQKQFSAGSNSRARPFAMEVGDVVQGVARNDRRDYFQFPAKAGQSLLIQVLAQRIDSRMDAAVAVYDAASGKRFGRVVQGVTRDPAMTFLVPADGDYVVEVMEMTYRGGDEFFYRLEVSERPQVQAIFPPVAQSGVSTEFTIYGFNLPNGQTPTDRAALGHLQSLQVTFAPDFGAARTFGSGIALGTVASAKLEGASVRLPIPLSGAEPVFLEQASREVTVEAASNDDPKSAQAIALPAVVAGQFHPRRDVDHYAFEAKQGQVYWVELASHQLGTSVDASVQIFRRQETDGKVTLQSLATADDIEGPPGSRDARRMYSGTSDCALRFQVPSDGTYVIAVRDQYNVAHDDPRLVYRLRVAPAKPDFQLVAFADPERHGDDKVAKPNGVSVVPGGATLVRVRLLPQHGFNEPVQVRATGLPAGVHANPLTLARGMREAFLVLSASVDAKADWSLVQIEGSTLGANAITRVARTAAVRRAANNLDSELTHGRLSQDLPVAVVDNTVPAVRLDVGQETIAATPGATVKLPVKLARKKDFGAELELVPLQVPKGIKVGKVKTKDAAAELSVQVEDAKLPAGLYTFPVAVKLKEKRPKNLIVVREAEKDVAKVTKVIAARATEVKAEEAKFGVVQETVAAMESQRAQAQKAMEAPKQKLETLLKSQQQVTQSLSDKLAAQLQDLGNGELGREITELQSKLSELQGQRAAIEQEFSEASESLATAALAVKNQADARAEAQKRLDAVKAKKAEADKQKAEADKRLADAQKAELGGDAEYWVYSQNVQLDIVSSPLKIRLRDQSTVNPGATAALPISLDRRFGFTGQVHVKPTLPKGSQLAAAGVVLGQGQDVAKLIVSAGPDAKPGVYDVTLEFQLNFNKANVTDKATCRIEVVK